MAFEDNSMEVISALNRSIEAFLEGVGGELEAQVKRNTTVDFGQLRSQWQHHVYANKQKVIIGNPLQNAIWEELGTGEHALNGDGRKGAWYVPVDGYMGTKKPTYNGKVIIVYGKDGKAFYKTNGKKPKRPLQKALDSTKPKIINYAKNTFGVIMK